MSKKHRKGIPQGVDAASEDSLSAAQDSEDSIE